PLTNWNTAKVTNMSYMFQNASAFNGAVGTWNTANVINMQGVFSGATAFNQNLSAWALNAGVNLTSFLDNTGLSCKNYADMLTTWAGRTVTGRTLGAASRTYGTNANTARATLISKGWTITDGGPSGSDCNFSEDFFVTKWDLSKNGTNNTLSFYTTVTGTGANYTWKTLDRTKSGVGSIKPNELAMITGLPANTTIELFIEPTNLKQFAIANGGDKQRLVEVEQWGKASWEKMEYAFSGASNLTVTATDIPNLAKVTSMESMFENCATLDGPDNIGLWNTAKVTNMKAMFSGAKAFGQSLTNWITSAVTNMSSMFMNTSFNADVSNWDVSKVTDMRNMFASDSSF
ncbi:MAG: BspA family leucine-rich repeat surface protein, partial [Pedobacter sp.]